MQNPLISVIIPVYNRAHSIAKSIESVLNQTYQNFEIIVVDDGSSDNLHSVLKTFNTIKLVTLHKNQGQANARKVGYLKSQGDFICSLDSDDTWEPVFIEESLNYMLKYNLDLFFSNWSRSTRSIAGNLKRFSDLTIFQNETEKEEDVFIFSNAAIRKYILSQCIFPSSSMMIRRTSLSVLWDESIRICDDWELTINLILNNTVKKVGGTYKIFWTKHVSDDNVCDNRSDIAFIERVIEDRIYMQQKFAPLMTLKEKKTFNTSIVESRLRKLIIGVKAKSLKTVLEVFSSDYFNRYLVRSIINGSRRRLKRKIYA
ncbi:glycosyl transferase, family GH2 [Tenacibaculum sp. 190130A14a]|uniref:Glyco_trans_2-like domain-containing protein n=1 Tax=Tenacibaculum polynesiense TaxID=3137857 RepID=A0ABP1F3E2_9FLAO